MTAAKLFGKAFCPETLKTNYEERIKYRSTAGMDNISPQQFESNLSNNANLISRKVLAGTYHFTRYREVLISKGRGKEPRVISIPSIRDKLALSAYHSFLHNVFNNEIEEPLLHTLINRISAELSRGHYDGYVKMDISKFYASIDHKILLRKIRRKIRKKEAIDFLLHAIKTQTIPRNSSCKHCIEQSRGVPEGLSISNILANIYLSDLEQYICDKFDVAYFRYVDDILILCTESQANEIKNYATDVLSRKFKLEASEQKTMAGNLTVGAPFLGYVFSNNGVSIRSAAIEKIENSIEELFRKYKKSTLPEKLFIWRLNLRITGCILDRKKYGWMFYYSQMNDLQLLYHLDWLLNHFCKRFKVIHDSRVKSFVRTYHEITKNINNSTYVVNADRYSIEQKRKTLADVYEQENLSHLTDSEVEAYFKEAMFRETQYLERDIQNFS